MSDLYLEHLSDYVVEQGHTVRPSPLCCRAHGSQHQRSTGLPRCGACGNREPWSEFCARCAIRVSGRLPGLSRWSMWMRRALHSWFTLGERLLTVPFWRAAQMTYRMLSSVLAVPANTAKQMLAEFKRQRKGKVHCTYLLCGYAKDAPDDGSFSITVVP